VSSEGKAEAPEWALALEGLGWLIFGLGAIAVMIIGSRLSYDGPFDRPQIVLFLGLGIGSAALFVGGIPVAVGRSRRPASLSPRWRLWSKLLLLSGGFFSVSIPSTIYGILPAGMEASRLTAEPVAPLDPELLRGVLFLGGPSFLIGAVLIAVALNWGRSKLPPSSPAVFD